VVAAGIRALVINSAEARLTIQVQAIVVAHALQGKNLGFGIEALDDAFLLQALGDVLRRGATLELIDDANADQVLDLHFDRQRAAAGHATTAHMRGIFLPRFKTVEFRGGDQLRLHQGSKRWGCIWARDHTGIGDFLNNIFWVSAQRQIGTTPASNSRNGECVKKLPNQRVYRLSDRLGSSNSFYLARGRN